MLLPLLQNNLLGTPPASSAVLTGTIVPSALFSEVVSGGQTVIITLTGDTFVAAGTGPIGSTADTQALIDGITSAQSEASGWNAEVRDNEVVGAVVRTSDTVATVTFTAAPAYAITAAETVTITVPAAVLTGGSPLVATPVFMINNLTSFAETVVVGAVPQFDGHTDAVFAGSYSPTTAIDIALSSTDETFALTRGSDPKWVEVTWKNGSVYEPIASAAPVDTVINLRSTIHGSLFTAVAAQLGAGTLTLGLAAYRPKTGYVVPASLPDLTVKISAS